MLSLKICLFFVLATTQTQLWEEFDYIHVCHLVLFTSAASTVQVFADLSPGLAMQLLRAAPANLGDVLAMLPEHQHHLAVEVCFPSLTVLPHSSLTIACDDHACSTLATALLQAPSVAQGPLQRLSMRHISFIQTSQSPFTPQFSHALNNACMSPMHMDIEIEFDHECSQGVVANIQGVVTALGSNTRLTSLQLTVMPKHCDLSLDELGHLTGLQSLSITVREWHGSKIVELPPAVSALTLLSHLQLQCFLPNCEKLHCIAKCLRGMHHLRSLDLDFHVRDVDDLDGQGVVLHACAKLEHQSAYLWVPCSQPILGSFTRFLPCAAVRCQRSG